MLAVLSSKHITLFDNSFLKRAPATSPSTPKPLTITLETTGSTPTTSAWSPDNSCLYVAFNGGPMGVKRFDAATGDDLGWAYLSEDENQTQGSLSSLLCITHAPTQSNYSLFFTTDSKLHLVTPFSRQPTQNLAEAKHSVLVDNPSPISCFSVSPDGAWLASYSEGSETISLRFLGSGSNEIAAVVKLPSTSLSPSLAPAATIASFHPHSPHRLLIGMSHHLLICDDIPNDQDPSEYPLELKPTKVISLDDDINAGEDIIAITSSPFSKSLVAVGFRDGRVALIDLEKDKGVFRDLQLGTPITSLSFSQEGASLYAGTDSGKVLICDLRALDKPPRVVDVQQYHNGNGEVENGKVIGLSVQRKCKPIERSSKPPSATSASKSAAKHSFPVAAATRRATANPAGSSSATQTKTTAKKPPLTPNPRKPPPTATNKRPVSSSPITQRGDPTPPLPRVTRSRAIPSSVSTPSRVDSGTRSTHHGVHLKPEEVREEKRPLVRSRTTSSIVRTSPLGLKKEVKGQGQDGGGLETKKRIVGGTRMSNAKSSSGASGSRKSSLNDDVEVKVVTKAKVVVSPPAKEKIEERLDVSVNLDHLLTPLKNKNPPRSKENLRPSSDSLSPLSNQRIRKVSTTSSLSVSPSPSSLLSANGGRAGTRSRTVSTTSQKSSSGASLVTSTKMSSATVKPRSTTAAATTSKSVKPTASSRPRLPSTRSPPSRKVETKSAKTKVNLGNSRKPTSTAHSSTNRNKVEPTPLTPSLSVPLLPMSPGHDDEQLTSIRLLSRSPSPDLFLELPDDADMKPFPRLVKERSEDTKKGLENKKRGMNVLGLGTPEVERWLEAGDPASVEEGGGIGAGGVKKVGFAKVAGNTNGVVGDSETSTDSDDDEQEGSEESEETGDVKETKIEMTVQISPRRPSATASTTWAAVPSPLRNLSTSIHLRDSNPRSSGTPFIQQHQHHQSEPSIHHPNSAQDLLQTLIRDALIDFRQETKADIVGLHLDLVRMGRGWRKDMREVLDAWGKELKDVREENKMLREENEMLKRNFGVS